MADLPVVTIDTEEDDDWMKSLPGYKVEVAIHEQLAKEYAAKNKKRILKIKPKKTS